MIEYWKNEFRNGYNPFVRSITGMTFNEALHFGLSKCDVSTATKRGYKSTIGFISQAAEQVNLSSMPITDIKRQHIMLMMEQGKKHFKWSGTSYNKHLNYLKSVLSHLVKWVIIENNPAHGIGNMKVVETQKYVPYTEAERKIITNHLLNNHYLFYVILNVLYHTGIRPKEILALKIHDIDLINSQITILPDIELENSKTKKIRKVPINRHLLLLLLDLNLNEYDPKCFVFGSPFRKGSKVDAAKHPDYFKPSLQAVKRDTITKLWNKVVMKELGINKHLYAAKSTGANAMILAGIELDSLKELFGHSSKLMTERYATEVKKKRFNEIIEKATAF